MNKRTNHFMTGFSKQCTICGDSFSSLEGFMDHIRNSHKNLAPEKFSSIGSEQKWKLRQD